MYRIWEIDVRTDWTWERVSESGECLKLTQGGVAFVKVIKCIPVRSKSEGWESDKAVNEGL